MSDWLETRLREATNERAEYAMTHTDTERELNRFRSQLASNRRSRRARIAVALTATAAVAGVVIVLVLALTGGTTTPKTLTPAPGATSTQAPTPVLPADYPLGTWVAVPAGQQEAEVTFIEGGIVNLRETFGNSNWHITFPAPHLLKFGVALDTEELRCGAATYRYHVSHKTLTFALVGKDKCLNRTSVLIHRGRTFKRTS